MASENKLETASVLAFERNFDISDAILSQKKQTDKDSTPVLVTEKSVRGTISNRLKNAIASDPAKLDAAIQKANLQTVDVAMLDNQNDTLLVKWSCKVLPFRGIPCVCNNMDYQEKLQSTIKNYIAKHGLASLAKRYAINIINGRWLWRNRMASDHINMTISSSQIKKPIIVEDVKRYSLNTFDYSDKEIEELAKLIEAGLTGPNIVMFDVQAELIMGLGQEVYPSQELILDKDRNKNIDNDSEKNKSKDKVLYVKPIQSMQNQSNTDQKTSGQAAIHSQKIGNAIRTIDTWYQDQVEFPIAVEPYGAVTTMGHAFRQPKHNDFYTLFDNWLLKDQLPKIEQQHYIIAVLIRGGVFGASGKE